MVVGLEMVDWGCVVVESGVVVFETLGSPEPFSFDESPTQPAVPRLNVTAQRPRTSRREGLEGITSNGLPFGKYFLLLFYIRSGLSNPWCEFLMRFLSGLGQLDTRRIHHCDNDSSYYAINGSGAL